MRSIYESSRGRIGIAHHGLIEFIMFIDCFKFFEYLRVYNRAEDWYFLNDSTHFDVKRKYTDNEKYGSTDDKSSLHTYNLISEFFNLRNISIQSFIFFYLFFQLRYLHESKWSNTHRTKMTCVFFTIYPLPFWTIDNTWLGKTESDLVECTSTKTLPGTVNIRGKQTLFVWLTKRNIVEISEEHFFAQKRQNREIYPEIFFSYVFVDVSSR